MPHCCLAWQLQQLPLSLPAPARRPLRQPWALQSSNKADAFTWAGRCRESVFTCFNKKTFPCDTPIISTEQTGTNLCHLLVPTG